MPAIEIRPFRRSDRDQLTDLVNAHVEAVLPGVTVSPNAVLGQLEREPGEYVVDPWVSVRHTIVAVHRERIAGAAHLLRYADDERVNPTMRGIGEIRWLLFWPGQNPAKAAEMADVADALTAAAVAHLRGSTRIGADFGLPAPAVYGVSDRWPHVAAALGRAGFVAGDRVEAVLAAAIDDLPHGGPAPVPDVEMRVALGGHATRFSAVLDGRVIGMYEADTDLTQGGTRSRLVGWADGWELWTAPEHRRRGIATWLLGHAADRMRFAGVRRVLDYAVAAPDPPDGTLAFLRDVGFHELTRTTRGWTLQ
ncbi:MAG TPA: GNAT family N-acetyltransferase [Pseudonocardia sp.]